MKPYLFTAVALAAAISSAQADDPVLEEVLVTAEFRPVALLDTAASITVFDAQRIEERSAVHLEQLLNLAPNVNFAAGASRGRFFQVRGIGERSQFVEPVNPSVGLLIDGMDFTGIGGVASTLDLRQVEVLRGPQGTLFGANALAGMINLVSQEPTQDFQGQAELLLGNLDQISVSAAAGGPLGRDLAWRVAVQSNRSDGYQDNLYLGRATNNVDELNVRTRLNWQASEALDLDLTVLLTDVDNGYDAFSLDNTRTTLSDQPGEDNLESVGLALKTRWSLAGGRTLEALLSHVDADSVYSYDEDWSYTGICEGTPCDSDLWGFDWWYSSFDAYTRGNQNTALDLRLLSGGDDRSTRWVGGLYLRDQQQTLNRAYTFAAGDFASRYDTTNAALYGQLDVPLAERWTATVGLRWEQRDWDYSDNSSGLGLSSDDEDFWGGRVALEYRTDNGLLWYGLVSRGYKPGGYNSALAAQLPDLIAAGIELPDAALVFDGETLVNLELGVKGTLLDGRLQLALALFRQDRDEVQVKQSIVIADASGACPCEFVDSLQNAAGGLNQGLELELDWLATDRLRVFGSLGLLDTEYQNYLSFAHAEADPENGIAYDLSGRAQAHAPDWQATLGAQVYLSDAWSVIADLEAKDAFYTSANHNEQTDSFTLLNLRLQWSEGPWTVALWGRNLGDEDVKTRGFGGFGNDPRKFYATEPYFQLGEPRVYGVQVALTY